MVCSCCKKSGHNIRTCPKMEVGAEKMAEAVAKGAAETACIGALTAICPPAGMAAALAAALKHMYDMAKRADQMANGKTQAERKRAAKLAIIAVAADAGD
mmetsp:Transcript_10177/g.26337  ORF Transcript_10177/g.26337 Transcript_10177/m.26337 type:complete len:100 (-) Transcript_10177:190-489(-)